jgi:GST-like protein
MILYAAPMSSATPVVHALNELRVPYELVPVDLQKGEQKRPAFLALNPNGKVPTAVVDGTPMFEALAIMQYLGDRFGVEKNLWPAFDTPERLTALSWTTWAYVTYGSALSRLIMAQSPRVPEALHHPAQAKHAREELDALLGILDGHLSKRACILGESFSLADVVVASVVTYGTYCGVPTEGFRHVHAWAQRFAQRPAFKKAWEAAAREVEPSAEAQG